MTVPRYTFDNERLATLDEYKILDSPADQGFDDIVQLAMIVCDAPVSLVSLVSHDRQWFKAKAGFEPTETDLDRSVCAHALVEADLLIVPDLTKDERTKNNPLVTGAPHIRFYAGAPLRAPNGAVLGSLCVIDGKPRPNGITESQATALRNLARQVVSQLELRKALSARDSFLVDLADADDRRKALLELGDRLRDVQSIPEMSRVAAEVVGKLLKVTRAGFGRIDSYSEYVDVEPDWSADGAASIAGRHLISDFGELLVELVRNGTPLIINDIETDPLTMSKPASLKRLGIRSLVNMSVQERGRTVALFFVHDDKPHRWSPEVLAFLRNVADRLESSVARVDAEARQQVLNLELSHRMKNTFAMVQALATQTLRPIADKIPVAAFTQRIHALSTAHDVLLQQSWVAANIRTVVTAVLGTLEKIERFTLQGPNINIGPRATLSFSLLLHELSTNALKYGALTMPAGKVEISWFVRSLEFCDELVFDWTESNGPAVREPEALGFGSKLIRMGLVGTGGVELRYLPLGLRATFTAPLEEVQNS